MLDRFDNDEQYRTSLLANGWTREQVAEHHEYNLREFQQGGTATLGRYWREQEYGRWRNVEEVQLRREQHIPRQYEWTSKQWG